VPTLTDSEGAFVYLLRCADDTLYCGWTTDVDRRLRAHQAGTASRYTRSRLPVALAAVIPVADRSAALREERRIKLLSRAEKLELAGHCFEPPGRGRIAPNRSTEVRMADGLIARFYQEVLAGENLDLIDELTTEDFVDHEEGLPGQPAGREGVKFFVAAMRAAFSDLRLTTIEPTLSQGDLEAARTIVSGTHTGEFMGLPPTNNSVEFESMDIIRVRDGKVAEHWGVTDVMALMQQLGAVPA
jgi:predicted GIY-YIG superfamily endonuclease/predicted ester cyclase